MLGRERKQSSFLDEEMFARFVPQEHPLMRIKREIDFSFVEEEAKQHYHPVNGRPGFPPAVLFRVLFLEIWAGLSDVQVCRELGYNLLYRYFCGLSCDDRTPDDTTLVVFRRRLGEETFQRLLARVVEQARDRGVLRGKWTIVDGTKIVAHAAVKNNLTLAREGRKTLLKLLARHDAEAAGAMASLGEPEQDAEYPNHELLLAAEMERGRQLLARLEDRTESDLVAVREIYRQVVHGGEVASLSDPDARWGFKRKDEPFLGYKAHVACEETGIVTAVRLTAGNESELPQVLSLVDEAKQGRGLGTLYVAADKGYDAADLRKVLRRKGMRAYVPAKADLGRLAREGFRYDRRRRRLVCPKGKYSRGSHPHRNGGFAFYFSQTDCQRCRRRPGCAGETRKRKVAYLKPEVHEYRPRGLKRAMRLRKTVERLFGEGKTWHRLGRSRYRGRWRVAVQVIMTFIVCNLKKVADRLENGKTFAVSRV